ncbi:hypothetical protein AB0I72_21500 [Nocardiopsis sp. NPDC049922]|uniref:hypothetical protein n=1 Tax=Nocardiopsis sp. NPDC049922 TaxID=3155157 RepID=UPI003407E9EC
MTVLRRWYGASALHLLLMVGAFALIGYAGVRLLGGDVVGVLVWFVGAAVLHDLVFLPGYSLVDRVWQSATGRLTRRRRTTEGDDRARIRLINHVRVPAVVSALLFVVYFPLVLGPSETYLSKSGLPGHPFAGRWLLVCAFLFAASAVVGAVRYLRASSGARSA